MVLDHVECGAGHSEASCVAPSPLCSETLACAAQHQNDLHLECCCSESGLRPAPHSISPPFLCPSVPPFAARSFSESLSSDECSVPLTVERSDESSTHSKHVNIAGKDRAGFVATQGHRITQRLKVLQRIRPCGTNFASVSAECVACARRPLELRAGDASDSADMKHHHALP